MFLTKTFPINLTGKIKYFYSLKGDVSQMPENTHRNLPDGTLELIINLGDPILKSVDGLTWSPGHVAMVTGLYQSKSFIRYTGKIHLVGAVFQPGYASQFVNDNLEHFSQCLYSADCVFKISNPLYDILNAYKTEEQKHLYLEKFLLHQFRESNDQYNVDRITKAVNLILQHKGNVTIPFLYKNVFMSERNFRRKFHDLIGLSAKQYTSIIRVKSIIKTHKLTGSSFLDLAYDLGYTDQSHLIKDFKLIAGIPPTGFFGQLHPVDSLFIHSPQR